MFAALGLFIAATSQAQIPAPSILPRPREMSVGSNAFTISANVELSNPAGFPAASHLQAMLEKGAGFRLLDGANGKNKITFSRMNGANGPEEYWIDVSPTEIAIRANDDRGAFLAVQTLRQLLNPGIETDDSKIADWKIPAVKIHDWPEFSWRGLHLDVSRHFFSVEFVKQYIDWIALHRMNTFHWHLIDDGGWRMESKKYPLLTTKGAWRGGGPGNWSYTNISFPEPKTVREVYGGFYTQEQIKEVVQYAKDRHINVVPEIEMPGHSWPALSCYPELGCRLPDRKIPNVYCPGNEKSFQFLESILDETLELFPSEFIHIGADEVDKSDWKRCPDCAARMKAEGLKSVDELQSYFVKRMEKYLRSKNRKLIGWDEILEGGLAPGAAVMSWRGIEGGRDAAKAAQYAVMSPTSHCYFDFSYGAISTQHVYNWNPRPDGLTAAQQKLILGGQANVWTEWIPTEERCEYQIFPRLAGLAESLWLPESAKDWTKFSTAMPGYLERLDKMGVAYHIAAPELPVNALFMKEGEQMDVNIRNLYPNSMKLRYTTDGTTPTQSSKELTSTLRLGSPGTYTFAYVSRQGVGETSRLTVVRSDFKLPARFSPGLRVEAYAGKFDKLPDFSKLKPTKTTTATGFDLSSRPNDEQFAMRFTGWLTVEKDGYYTFSMGSDDGSRFLLGNAVIIDHDGLHGYSEKQGRAMLKKGRYPLTVEFFEAGGAERLTLTWALNKMALAPIPAKNLAH